MKKLDLKNKIWVYSSIMFMGTLLAITLTLMGSYSYRLKKLNTNTPTPNIVDNSASITAQKDAEIKDLQDKNTALQSQVNSLKSSTSGANNDAYINLMQADDFSRRGDYGTSLDIINKLNENSFQGYALDKYRDLKNFIHARAARTFYDQGMRAYRKRDYNTAANLLSKASVFGDEQVFVDDAAYYAAFSYKAIGDSNSAKIYLDFLFGTYPKSPFIANAKKLYNTL